MEVVGKLPGIAKLRREIGLEHEEGRRKADLEAELARIFRGQSDKFLLVVGPCSADCPKAVMEYAAEVTKIASKAEGKLFVVLRAFTAKPRSFTEGYMGLVHETDGLRAARRLHVDVFKTAGLLTADELLYPALYPYFSDVVSYLTVGARSVENQEHRLVASGIKVPVGLKNPTNGDVFAMVNAVFAAQRPHNFYFGGKIMASGGNPIAHGILRGGSLPNYSEENLLEVCEMYTKAGIINPSIVIDTNHGNSGKNHAKQPEIALEIMKMRQKSPAIHKLVKGLMIESYIEEGNQAADGVAYGRSVTDPCLSLTATRELIAELTSF